MLSLTILALGCGARESSGSTCDTACTNAKRVCSNYDDAKCKANCDSAVVGVRDCVALASNCKAAENCFSTGGDGGT